MTVADIRNDLYPDAPSHEIPRLVLLGPNNEGFASGRLEPGRCTLVKLYRKKLPKKRAAESS